MYNTAIYILWTVSGVETCLEREKPSKSIYNFDDRSKKSHNWNSFKALYRTLHFRSAAKKENSLIPFRQDLFCDRLWIRSLWPFANWIKHSSLMDCNCSTNIQLALETVSKLCHTNPANINSLSSHLFFCFQKKQKKSLIRMVLSLSV